MMQSIRFEKLFSIFFEEKKCGQNAVRNVWKELSREHQQSPEDLENDQELKFDLNTR